ncbi:MAG: type transport system permease protein [Streptomyces sp.]|jgi:ABC-2 type transport system permease protein|nr:type transport system permease protein [Streptomyces sp.]
MPHDAALRTTALVRHNTLLLLREPGPLLSRIILPLAFVAMLRPLYVAAQGGRAGTAQAVMGTLVTFSLLAMGTVGASLLTERLWHTWERLRATPARPAELLLGKALPVMAAMLAQQAVILAFGILVLGMPVADPPLLALALLAWTAALLGMGAALGVLARSFGELSAGYDIGGMLLSGLGGALVPLAAMPHWVRAIAPASPGYWGISALRAALHGSTGETLRACALLGAFALVFGALAALRAGRGWSRSAKF